MLAWRVVTTSMRASRARRSSWTEVSRYSSPFGASAKYGRAPREVRSAGAPSSTGWAGGVPGDAVAADAVAGEGLDDPVGLDDPDTALVGEEQGAI